MNKLFSILLILSSISSVVLADDRELYDVCIEKIRDTVGKNLSEEELHTYIGYCLESYREETDEYIYAETEDTENNLEEDADKEITPLDKLR